MTVRVLIVDDEPAIVRSLEQLAKLHGHAFDSAGDIETAKNRLQQHRYDYMFLDLNLPVADGDLDGRRENGLFFIRYIRAVKELAELPIIVITGHDRNDADFIVDVVRTGGSDFTEYERKPLAIDRLDKKIQWALAAPNRRVKRPACGNVFVQRGQAWVLQFAGSEEFYLQPSKGAAYLYILLSNPHERISAADLECRVNREPARYHLAEAIDATDEEATASYKAHFEDLVQKKAAAVQGNDQAALDRITQQMIQLAALVKKDQGLGGRIRKVAGDRERIRKRVGKAVRDALAILAAQPLSAPLAEHLNPKARPAFLSMGGTLIYAPPDGIRWNADPA